MKTIQFTPQDLSTKAFEMYSSSDYTFSEKDGKYTCYETPRCTEIVFENATLKDVEDFFINLDEE